MNKIKFTLMNIYSNISYFYLSIIMENGNNILKFIVGDDDCCCGWAIMNPSKRTRTKSAWMGTIWRREREHQRERVRRHSPRISRSLVADKFVDVSPLFADRKPFIEYMLLSLSLFAAHCCGCWRCLAIGKYSFRTDPNRMCALLRFRSNA